MSIVLDANVIATASKANTPYSLAARERLDRWLADAEDLHAPQLFTYELASALSSMERNGDLTTQAIDDVWDLVDALDITFHPPSSGANLMAITRRLRRRSAYDAAYIDLALLLQTELWSLDGKLVRNAESAGFPVRLVC